MESPQYLMRPSASTLKSFKCRSPIIPHASYGTAGRLAYRAPMVAEALPPLEHRLEAVARAQGFAAFGIARADAAPRTAEWLNRSEEPTSELQSLMRNSYAVFCLKKK